MDLSPTWKAFFNSRATNADGNKSPGSYLSAWTNDTSSEAKLAPLTNDPSLAVLAGEQGHGINILHSFKNLGRTILAPTDKIACLIGANQSAPIVIVNEIALVDT